MNLGKRLTTLPTPRVAIIGTDSSRPDRLLAFLTSPGESGHCRVTHVVPARDRTIHDVLGAVDAALLCTRDGRDHAAQALPLLENGISVWVDKPLATREEDARAMVRAATDRGVVLACRSGFRDAEAVRWAAGTGASTFEIAGPADPSSPYGGLAHYGIHHIEIACEVARRPLSLVEAADTGAFLVGRGIAVRLDFGAKAFSIAADGDRRPVEAPPRYLEDQVADFLTAVENGCGTTDPEPLVEPVRLLEAIVA